MATGRIIVAHVLSELRGQASGVFIAPCFARRYPDEQSGTRLGGLAFYLVLFAGIALRGTTRGQIRPKRNGPVECVSVQCRNASHRIEPVAGLASVRPHAAR